MLVENSDISAIVHAYNGGLGRSPSGVRGQSSPEADSILARSFSEFKCVTFCSDVSLRTRDQQGTLCTHTIYPVDL